MENALVTGFLRNAPPLTRVLILTIAVINLLVYLGTLYPHQLTYSRYYLPKLQFHRIFTCFLYFGRLNLEVALHILFLYRYSSMLEESCHRTSDYFYLLLVVSSVLFLISNIYHIPLLGSSLSSTITYIWTRRNPQAIVQIMGFVSFYAFYLPFIVPITTLIFEGRVSIDEAMGIIVGHIVFYFMDVYPRFGQNFLRTPCWCHRLFRESCEHCRLPRVRRRTLREMKNKAADVNPEVKETASILEADVKEPIINRINENLEEIKDIVKEDVIGDEAGVDKIIKEIPSKLAGYKRDEDGESEGNNVCEDIKEEQNNKHDEDNKHEEQLIEKEDDEISESLEELNKERKQSEVTPSTDEENDWDSS